MRSSHDGHRLPVHYLKGVRGYRAIARRLRRSRRRRRPAVPPEGRCAAWVRLQRSAALVLGCTHTRGRPGKPLQVSALAWRLESIGVPLSYFSDTALYLPIAKAVLLRKMVLRNRTTLPLMLFPILIAALLGFGLLIFPRMLSFRSVLVLLLILLISAGSPSDPLILRPAQQTRATASICYSPAQSDNKSADSKQAHSSFLDTEYALHAQICTAPSHSHDCRAWLPFIMLPYLTECNSPLNSDSTCLIAYISSLHCFRIGQVSSPPILNSKHIWNL